jgi:hypothetical protein
MQAQDKMEHLAKLKAHRLEKAREIAMDKMYAMKQLMYDTFKDRIDDLTKKFEDAHQKWAKAHDIVWSWDNKKRDSRQWYLDQADGNELAADLFTAFDTNRNKKFFFKKKDYAKMEAAIEIVNDYWRNNADDDYNELMIVGHPDLKINYVEQFEHTW